VSRVRADARRNEETLLNAAAAIFVTSGVEAPTRDIAAKAGVGTRPQGVVGFPSLTRTTQTWPGAKVIGCPDAVV
jgi:hypothetical protein